MKHFKDIVTFFIINLIVVSLITVSFNGAISSVVFKGKLWVVALITSIIGQSLGYLFFITTEESKRKRTTIVIVSTICTLLFTCGFFFLIFSRWKHENKYANIESNADYFKYFISNNKEEKKIAFDSLISKFTNANDLKLNGSSSISFDSTINTNIEKVLRIDFRYSKKNEQGVFKSQYLIVKNQAKLVFFDRKLNTIERFQIDSINKKATNTLNQSLQKIPDSIAKEIKEEFEEVL